MTSLTRRLSLTCLITCSVLLAGLWWYARPVSTEARPQSTSSPPVIRQDAQHTTSQVPLRDAVPVSPPQVAPAPHDTAEWELHQTMVEQLQDGDRDSVTDAVVTTPDHPLSAYTVQSFDGQRQRENGVVRPPDPTGEVGWYHFVQATNLGIQVFDKEGVALSSRIPLGTLWVELGQPCSTNYGDPNVLYDQFAHRWFISQFVIGAPGGMCIAVSTGEDPLGTYHLYYFPLTPGYTYDYPNYGIWHDGYYLSSNLLNPQFQNVGVSFVAFERDVMLNGDTARSIEMITDGIRFTVVSDAEGATLPPSDVPPVFIRIWMTNALTVWRFYTNWANPADSYLSAPLTLTIPEYEGVCFGCVMQPDTTRQLAPWMNILLRRASYRHYGTHDALVVAHSVNSLQDGGAGRPSFRWYEIRGIATNTYEMHQQSTYDPTDDTARWVTSLAQDKFGNLMVSYSVASSTVYPGIRYTGRLAEDALNTLAEENSLIEGGGAQTGDSRWGDYAAMSLDPADDCTFWFTHAYMQNTASFDWATRIGAARFPMCEGTGITPTPLPTHTPSATPVPTETPIPTETASATPTLVVTETPTASVTPSPTAPTATSVPPSATSTATVSPTPTKTPLATATISVSVTPTHISPSSAIYTLYLPLVRE